MQRDGAVAWSSPVWVTSPDVPRVRGIRAIAGPDAIRVVWLAQADSPSGRLRLLRRCGNDGGGDLARFTRLAEPRLEPAAALYEDSAVPGPGMTCHYALSWLPTAGDDQTLLGLVSAELAREPERDGDRLVIPFFVEEPGPVAIEIRDLTTRVVRRFELDDVEPGAHRVLWDGRDVEGRPCRGLHFYQVTSTGGTTQRKPLRLGLPLPARDAITPGP